MFRAGAVTYRPTAIMAASMVDQLMKQPDGEKASTSNHVQPPLRNKNADPSENS